MLYNSEVHSLELSIPEALEMIQKLAGMVAKHHAGRVGVFERLPSVTYAGKRPDGSHNHFTNPLLLIVSKD